MESKEKIIDDITFQYLNFDLGKDVPCFIVNDGTLLNKETFLLLPYRFVLVSTKKRLDYYTPYFQKAVNSRFPDFGGEGEKYLRILQNDVLSELVEKDDYSKLYYGGISLGGLHSIYASTKKDFPIIHYYSICGSFWFPKFTDYLKENLVKCNADFVLLNGEKEGVKHSNTPLEKAFEKANDVKDILTETNKVIFISDKYGHHDKLNERFIRIVDECVKL